MQRYKNKLLQIYIVLILKSEQVFLNFKNMVNIMNQPIRLILNFGH
jgi:hypothetical protein